MSENFRDINELLVKIQHEAELDRRIRYNADMAEFRVKQVALFVLAVSGFLIFGVLPIIRWFRG